MQNATTESVDKMKFVLASAAVAASATVLAGVYGDCPDAKHAWSVHDRNRPNPVKVEPAAKCGQPPSDAVVLFDGTRESFEKNWCDGKGNPTQWKYDDQGFFYCVPGWKNGGSVYSREKFGDCQLHLEYSHEASLGLVPNNGPQMHGNSGVFLMGNYEIQVLESYGTNPADMKNPNYADGQAGAVYAENPPMVNPARKPGEWQVYDIVFHQPVWEGEKLLHPGSVTVFFNGVLVQDHWEMEGLTTHCNRRPLKPHEKVGQLNFQDHGCTVRFRNIWYRPLPSRWDNTTHSELAGKEEDVMALRRETAAKLFAKLDANRTDAGGVNDALEVVSYSREDAYVAVLRKMATAYMAKLDKMDDAALDKEKGAIMSLLKASNQLTKAGASPKNCCLNAKLNEIKTRKGWK